MPLRIRRRLRFTRALPSVITLAALTIFFPIDSVSNASDSWGTYTGKDEEFSVRMPRQPSLYFNTITNRSGKQISERIYSTYSNGAVYLVVSYDRNSLKDTLENFKVHHCAQAQIALIKDKSLDGFVGKEYSLKFGDVVGTLDIYATTKRGYAVATVQAGDNTTLRDYFLSTFSLSGRSDSTPTPPEIQSLQLSDWYHLATNGKQAERKPVVVSKPEPSYTEEARKADITGTVVLRVIFASTGEVTNIRVVSGLSKGLTEQAVAAARELKFIPGTKEGKLSSYWLELQYNFHLY